MRFRAPWVDAIGLWCIMLFFALATSQRSSASMICVLVVAGAFHALGYLFGFLAATNAIEAEVRGRLGAA